MNKKNILAPKAPTLEKPVEKKVRFSIDLRPKITSLPEIKDKTKIDLRYALIVPYAYVHIYWDDVQGELIYNVEEPNLDTKEKETLNLVRQGIEELINMSFISVKERESLIEYLEKNVSVLLKEFGIELEKNSYLKIMYYIYRDFVGLNRIEPLMNDYYIEDIECNGKNSPLYIVHRKLGNIKTNIIYYDFDELLDFVEKLAQKCGKYISYATPLLDAALPDGSRCNATFTEDVTSRGPSFSIRKFTREPWSPIKLMQIGSVSAELLAYLWLLIENGSNILIVGGTGSGKTTFLNSIAFFIPPEDRIISIEDTRELNLVHENWLPSVARAGILGLGGSGEKSGEISLFDLLKESFRQRPDYVIVGEVRGSIRGEEEVVVIENGLMQRLPIKKLEKENIDALFVPTLNLENKIKFSKIYDFIKHKSYKSLVKIKTRSGREVTITPQHSLFGIKNLLIKPIEANELRKGSKILIPSKMPCGFNNINYLNVFRLMPESRVECDLNLIRKAISVVGQENSNRILGCVARQYCRSSRGFMKFYQFDKLMRKAGIKYNFDDLRVRNGNSYSIPSRIKINDGFLRFLGYYISEGYTMQNRRTIIITNSNEKILNDIISICETEFGIRPYTKIVKGLGISTQVIINNPILAKLIYKLGCGRVSDEKRIPAFIYGLNKQKIGMFLKALFTGDGCFDGNEVMFFSKSKKLIEDVSYALLVFEIVVRISEYHNCWRLRFKGRDEILTFLNEIGFVKEVPVMNSVFSRYNCNTIQFEPETLERYIHIPRRYRHLRRFKSCSKKYLFRLVSEVGINNRLSKLASGEFYIDEIKDIEEVKLDKPEYVYDFVVLPAHNFVGGFGGVLLHNTEAYVLFQGMASGHPSLSTMHADDVATVIRRLQTPPINLSPSLVETLDAVCLMTFAKVEGKETRKVRAVEEIIEVDERGKAKINIPFEWNPRTNRFMFKRQSIVLDKLVMKKGISREKLNIEFTLRSRLLLKLYEKKIFDFVEVQKIIHAYYKTPERVLKRFNLQ